MSAFSLTPDIYFCASDGAYIFLDARTDRYFAYTADTARLFSEIISTDRTEQLSQNAERLTDHLLRSGVLLRPAAKAQPLKACTAARPETSRFEQACLLAADTKSSDWSHMLTALVRSWSLKRTHSLRGVISGARRWKENVPSGHARTLDDVTGLTAQFLALAPFLFTTKDACLFRSLFLMRFLAGHGIAVTWTFGVRLAPFGAHCWVEYEGAVLNDHLEHVGGFAPILAI
ncbi:MAG: lasso peptide biosynthesis B2 protein [Hyphomonas sp.]